MFRKGKFLGYFLPLTMICVFVEKLISRRGKLELAAFGLLAILSLTIIVFNFASAKWTGELIFLSVFMFIVLLIETLINPIYSLVMYGVFTSIISVQVLSFYLVVLASSYTEFFVWLILLPLMYIFIVQCQTFLTDNKLYQFGLIAVDTLITVTGIYFDFYGLQKHYPNGIEA